jgi:O-methyltransferase involved in polyketide biosynthesis
MTQQSEPLSLNISGVPETMLWALYNRAAEARRTNTVLHDPMAVQVAERIPYDYARFGKPEAGQVMRAVTIDRLLKDWIQGHPSGQVIALGEGLETQFHRVDNGNIRWLSIDLPEVIAIRTRFLPDTDQRHNLACSALDFRWMKC